MRKKNNSKTVKQAVKPVEVKKEGNSGTAGFRA